MRKIQQKLKNQHAENWPLVYWNNGNVQLGRKSKRKHKFSGTKVCRGKEIREYLINPKIENFFFG